VSLVVINGIHMLIGGFLGIESSVTGLALKWRFAVSCIIHVLVHWPLSKECSITCIAHVTWARMVECAHDLYGSLPVTEPTVICILVITWSPMVECVHVLYVSLPAAEITVTCLALKVVHIYYE